MRFADDVTAATFELFNVWSDHPDWVLDARAPHGRLRITGTVAAPALPGPSTLEAAYIDEPRGYTYRPITSALHVRRLDLARVRVEGSVRVDGLAIDIELVAALVT